MFNIHQPYLTTSFAWPCLPWTSPAISAAWPAVTVEQLAAAVTVEQLAAELISAHFITLIWKIMLRTNKCIIRGCPTLVACVDRISGHAHF